MVLACCCTSCCVAGGEGGATSSLGVASTVWAGFGGGAGLRRAGALGAAFLLPTAELIKAGMVMRCYRSVMECTIRGDRILTCNAEIDICTLANSGDLVADSPANGRFRAG